MCKLISVKTTDHFISFTFALEFYHALVPPNIIGDGIFRHNFPLTMDGSPVSLHQVHVCTWKKTQNVLQANSQEHLMVVQVNIQGAPSSFCLPLPLMIASVSAKYNMLVECDNILISCSPVARNQKVEAKKAHCHEYLKLR